MSPAGSFESSWLGLALGLGNPIRPHVGSFDGDAIGDGTPGPVYKADGLGWGGTSTIHIPPLAPALALDLVLTLVLAPRPSPNPDPYSE